MGSYRDSHFALQLRARALDHELAAAQRRALASEEAQRDLAERLERMRDGVAEEDSLEERGLRRWRAALHCLALVGLATAATSAAIFMMAYFPEPNFSWQGVRNAVWVVRDDAVGLLGGCAILVLGTPWFAIPWLGSVGLRKRRRWGWLMSVIACLLWLPTPLFPLPAYALTRLFRFDTRRVFFDSRA